MGGGSYDQINQMKIGRWIESSDGFYNQSQVTYHGAYVNDKKFSRWDIFFKGEYEEEFKKIVCGQYAEEGNEIRVGRWTELSNGFKDDSQVTQKRRIFKLQKSCGDGLYDEEGNKLKIGQWIELSDEFEFRQTLLNLKGI